MGLTKAANEALGKMAPGHVYDLCNALAGMGTAERKDFINSLAARAHDPLKIERSLSRVEDWWEEKIRTQITLSARPEEGWLRELPIAELTHDYIEYTKRTGITERGNSTAMGRFVKSVLPNRTISSRKVGQVKRRVRYYEFPAHDAAKRFWRDYLAKRRR